MFGWVQGATSPEITMIVRSSSRLVCHCPEIWSIGTKLLVKNSMSALPSCPSTLLPRIGHIACAPCATWRNILAPLSSRSFSAQQLQKSSSTASCGHFAKKPTFTDFEQAGSWWSLRGTSNLIGDRIQLKAVAKVDQLPFFAGQAQRLDLRSHDSATQPLMESFLHCQEKHSTFTMFHLKAGRK